MWETNTKMELINDFFPRTQFDLFAQDTHIDVYKISRQNNHFQKEGLQKRANYEKHKCEAEKL